MVRKKGELFGVDPEVCGVAWDLVSFNLGFPKRFQKVHLMWALSSFTNVQNREQFGFHVRRYRQKTKKVGKDYPWTCCVFKECSGEWYFLEKIIILTCRRLVHLYAFFKRLYGRIASKMMQGKIVQRQSIVTIASYTSILGQWISWWSGPSICSSSKNLDSGMKLACASQHAILCGCAGNFHVGGTPTSLFFCHFLSNCLDKGEKIEYDDAY